MLTVSSARANATGILSVLFVVSYFVSVLVKREIIQLLANTVERASNGETISRSELDNLICTISDDGNESSSNQESGLDLVQRTFQSITIRVVKSLEK